MSKDNFLCRSFSIFQIAVLVFSLSPNLFAQKRIIKAPQTVFSNTTPITINTATGLTAPTKATLYPSTIDISGMTGTTTRVAVTLDGINAARMSDLDFLLVSPTGAKYIFFSDGLATTPNTGLDDKIFTFADDAATTFPIGSDVPSGSYKPSSGDTGADTFPAPAPASPYSQPPSTATFAAVFNGVSPNGTWSLYAVDDSLNGAAGSVSSGWALTVTTDGAPTTFTNSTYIGLHDVTEVSAPYGTTINVSNVSGVISNLKVTLNGFSHTNAQDVDILLVSPNGKGLILMSDAGFGATGNANLTFDDAAAGQIPTNTIPSGSYKPTDASPDVFVDNFPAPAPLRPYYTAGSTQLSNFNGYSPNGNWQLFVVDDSQSNAGSISGGWSLDITTVPSSPQTPQSCAAPTFSPTNFSTGLSPTNVAVADFNNDTKPDLAVTNQVTNDVSILLGNGNGSFAPQMLFSVGSSPYSIVAGKFNADSNWDLAVTNSASNNVSILLGNGTGGFSAPTNFFVGSNPISIASGDFNNDTKADLVVANFGGFFSGTVSVLLGTGSGTFTNGTSVRTRSQPSFVAVSNFNGDGNQDLIVANFGSDSVSTFFGNGAGSFQLQQNITTGAGPVSIEIADFGTDGISDIAVANYNADTITYCNGTALGGFTGCSLNNPANGNNPISITSADFVGSGTKTIATALSGSNVINVLTSSVAVGQNPNAVDSADFNGDGKPDIVSVNFGSNDVSVLINSCVAAKGNIFDYNGDRRTDYSVYRPGGTAYFVQSLNSNSLAKVFGRATDQLVPADYNGDRKTDFAIYRPSNGLWYILDQNSKPIYFTQFGLPNDVPVPADYDGDGKTDIAVWRPSDGNWYIRRSSDNVTAIATFGMNGDNPAPADYDGDGKDDLAIFRPSTGEWYVFRSSDGQFFITVFGTTGDKTVSGDYDGDGKADIAVWRPSTGAWYVLKSSDGGFIASSWGMIGDFPVIGDFEGDGKYDFAVWRPSDGVWYVRKSSDNGGLYFTWGLSIDTPIPSSFVR